jgi:hypothetical protein
VNGRNTHKEHGDLRSLLLFFQNKESVIIIIKELLAVPEMRCFLDTNISYQIRSLASSDKKRIDQPLLQGY